MFMATAPSRTILSRTRGFDDAVPLLTELGWVSELGFYRHGAPDGAWLVCWAGFLGAGSEF
jgi:hypothetical protein